MAVVGRLTRPGSKRSYHVQEGLSVPSQHITLPVDGAQPHTPSCQEQHPLLSSAMIVSDFKSYSFSMTLDFDLDGSRGGLQTLHGT